MGSGAPGLGRLVDGFELGEHIHSGAMGDIYRVLTSVVSFPCIMKIPRLRGDQSAEGLLAFETEVMILPALEGERVPRFVAAGDIAVEPYLVQEWLDGKNLGAILENGPLTIDEVARLGAGIADALQGLHGRDTIHFDLKPENVIVRPDGQVFLIDFGLAHHAHFPDLLAEERRYTAGSAPYVSPEQVLGSRTDPRSDLFALGVLLYEMTTGELPFGTPVSMAGLRDRLWRDPAPPRSLRADMPPWLQEIVLRCLEPAAPRRYQSAAHISFDLRNPEQVELTARSARMHRIGLLSQMRRWWSARNIGLAPRRSARTLLERAPVILAAIDTTHPEDERHPAIRDVIARVMSISADFRLICLAVIRGGPMGIVASDATHAGHQPHLVRLRHWASPLGAPDRRLSLHVLESDNAAGAIVDFARANHVSLIVVGAPGPDQQRLAWWRSVASGVTAHAHCSVHVVRVPHGQRVAELDVGGESAPFA